MTGRELPPSKPKASAAHAAALLGVLTSIGSTAHADLKDVRAANNQVSLSAMSTDLRYRETDATGVLDSEAGAVPGARLALVVSPGRSDQKEGVLLRMHTESARGSTRYVGQRISGGGYGSVVASSGARFRHNALDVGYSFNVADSVLITPYIGIGRREWDRTLTTYAETYRHSETGIGAILQGSPAPGWVLTADAMLGSTVAPTLVVTGLANSGQLTLNLGKAPVTRIGLSADYAFTKAVHGFIGIELNRYKYGRSAWIPLNAIMQVSEPDSKTESAMVRIGMGYAFW